MIVTAVDADAAVAHYSVVGETYTVRGDELVAYRLTEAQDAEQVWRLGTVHALEPEELIAQRDVWDEELEDTVFHEDFLDTYDTQIVALGWQSTWEIGPGGAQAIRDPIPYVEQPVDQQESPEWRGVDLWGPDGAVLRAPLDSGVQVVIPPDVYSTPVWHGVVTAWGDGGGVGR